MAVDDGERAVESPFAFPWSSIRSTIFLSIPSEDEDARFDDVNNGLDIM